MPILKLTEKAVARLRAPDPSGNQILYWDTALKGFGVLCSGTSDVKTFVVKGAVGGRVVRRKLGRVGVLSINEARIRAKEMLAGFFGGVDPRVEAVSCVTLRGALDAYLKARQDNLKPRSLKGYRVETERHLGGWMNMPLKSITREMVEARHRSIAEEVQHHHRKAAAEAARRHLARAERVEEQWPEAAARHRIKWEAAKGRKVFSGHATANRVMRGLRAVHNFMAERVSDMPPSPVKLRRQWYKVRSRERCLRDADMPAFYRGVMALPNAVARDYILLLLFTGLRRREAAGLRWADVDLQRRSIRVPDTKSGRPLDLPMADVVHDLMVARRSIGKTEHVFPANSASKHIESVKFFFNQVAEASGIRISAHDLRRTYITTAEDADISVMALKALVNHSLGRGVTEGYVQMSVERLREPAQRVADKLKAACGIVEPANVTKLKGKRVSKG
jgi:integrase